MRKVELAEEDFKVLLDIKDTIEILLDKLNEVLARHIVRDPAWKGQVVSFEAKRLKLEKK